MIRAGAFALILVVSLFAGCASFPKDTTQPGGISEGDAFVPHVVVGVSDTGINPYHELFYRPNLTQAPCTYIRDFTCDIKELRLTLGTNDWDAAFEVDRPTWEGLERDTWYWIPRTPFVAVRCDTHHGSQSQPQPRTDICVLDDETGIVGADPGHGTGVTGIILHENPSALIAFSEGMFSGTAEVFAREGIPVDIVSQSHGSPVPRPLVRDIQPCSGRVVAPIHVAMAGNFAAPTWLDCQSGHPQMIAVGGGGTTPIYTANAVAASQGDVTSYFCRPVAERHSVTAFRASGEWCGTSWAAPAVAGALSKVILAVRQESGYLGSITPNDMVDPILGITIAELRAAMNLTASFAPPAKHARVSGFWGYLEVPVNPRAPWVQWGWGFYDGDIAIATIAHLIGWQQTSQKPAEAVAYMDALYELRRGMYG